MVWLSAFPFCSEREKKGYSTWEVQKYVNKIYACRICFFRGWGCVCITEMATPCRGTGCDLVHLLPSSHTFPDAGGAKPNTVENIFKDPSSCVTTVTFILIPVKIQTIQSHASGYKIKMIRVLQGISPLQSHTQWTVPWVTEFLETLGIYWAPCDYVSETTCISYNGSPTAGVNFPLLCICLLVSATVCYKLAQWNLALLEVGVGSEDFSKSFLI